MAKKDIKNDDFSFEEKDDPRTSTGELIPDCEKVEESPVGDDILEAQADEILPDLMLLEYVAEFRALINACGWVSYYMNMKNGCIGNVSKIKLVAAAYEHDAKYYTEQYDEWRYKAEQSYVVLSLHAGKLGYSMPNKSDFLNGLTFYKKRRECYKYYLEEYLPKGETFSPAELEKKYNDRLKKQLKRKKK